MSLKNTWQLQGTSRHLPGFYHLQHFWLDYQARLHAYIYVWWLSENVPFTNVITVCTVCVHYSWFNESIANVLFWTAWTHIVKWTFFWKFLFLLSKKKKKKKKKKKRKKKNKKKKKIKRKQWLILQNMDRDFVKFFAQWHFPINVFDDPMLWMIHFQLHTRSCCYPYHYQL